MEVKNNNKKSIKCRDCGEDKPRNEFIFHSSGTLRSPCCKTCRNQLEKKRREQLRNRAAVDISTLPPKTCSECKETLPATIFTLDMNQLSYLDSRCHQCNNTRSKKRQAEMSPTSKDEQRKKAKKLYVEMYSFIKDNRRRRGNCVECGETDSNLIEFDHINREDKVAQVTALTNKKAILEEMEKCQNLCVFCHRLKTMEENKKEGWGESASERGLQGRQLISGNKLKIGSCYICSRPVKPDTVSAFDFDHHDQTTKRRDVGGMILHSLQSIEDEMKKCSLLCACCHKKRTGVQLGWNGYEIYAPIFINYPPRGPA